jgi:uncharacterized RDD family membrane protein YckC
MTAGGPPPLPPPDQPPAYGGGQQYPPPPYLPPQAPAYPVAAYYAGPGRGPAPGIAYAGFWIRFLAILIDEIILFVPLVIIFIVTHGPEISSFRDCVQNGTLMSLCNTYLSSVSGFELIGLGVSALYSILLWSTIGGTLGQRALGLHVVDAATGKHLGIGRAIARYLGFLISAICLDIGLIWAAFDSRKQGWHDKMASTFVVRKV